MILLLVTPAFFASDYCQSVELKCALDRQRDDEASVIPVIMKEGDYVGAPFSHLKELPTDGLAKGRSVTGKKWKNRDEALRDVTEGIRKQLEALQARRVVNQAERVYRAKGGRPPSAEDRAEISGLVQSFGRIVAGRRVLWVDDLPENNTTEIATLQELGVQVATSTSTADALGRLRSDRFDLVISDWVRHEPDTPAAEGPRRPATARGDAQSVTSPASDLLHGLDEPSATAGKCDARDESRRYRRNRKSALNCCAGPSANWSQRSARPGSGLHRHTAIHEATLAFPVRACPRRRRRAEDRRRQPRRWGHRSQRL